MAQQGFPPGRHSREPDAPPQGGYDQTGYPDEPPYLDEGAYRDDVANQNDAPNQNDALYRDEGRHRVEAPSQGQGTAHTDHRTRGDRPRSAERPRTERPRTERPRTERAGWQQLDPFGPEPDTDSDLPPWAGPFGHPGRSTGTLRRPVRPRPDHDEDERLPGDAVDGAPGQGDAATPDGGRVGRRRGRAAATRLRKSRRRVYRWCGVAIVVCVVAAGIVAIVTHHNPKPALYVTSLQHGEFKSVPAACSSVSATMLNQFMPAAGRRTSTGNLASATASQCSFTVDAKPNFLVLEIQAQAYEPFAAAAGDGSASGNAQDNFVLAQQALAHPPKKSPLPAAQISKLTGVGQQAFMAFQDEHVSGIVTDVVTVVIRERNVVITASMSGQESGHGFGPVPVSTLTAGATEAAKSMLAKVKTQPTV